MALFQVRIQLFIQIFNSLMSLLIASEAENFFPSLNTTNFDVLPYTTLCNFIDYSPNSTIICVKGHLTNYTYENNRKIPFPITHRTKRHIDREGSTVEDSEDDVLFEIKFNDTAQPQEEKLFDESDNNNHLLAGEDIRLDDQPSEDIPENDVPETDQVSKEENLASKFIGIIQVKVPHIIRPYFWRPEATENANNHDFTNTGFRIPNFLALPNLFWDRLNRRGSALLSNAQNAIFGSGNGGGHEEYPAAFKKIQDLKH